MEEHIEYFKSEKLNNFYSAIKKLSEILKTNSLKINELWLEVDQDSIIKELNNK